MGLNKGDRSFTYGHLKDILATLTPEQLLMDVTVCDNQTREYTGYCGFCFQDGDDVLDDGHPYILFTWEADTDE